VVQTRKRVSAKEKAEVAAAGTCYVCSDLGLDHAGFDGYELKDIAFDHYQTAFGNVGGASANGDTLPIHAAAGGSIPDDPEFETSTRRNCHRLRSNEYSTRAGYVQILRARLDARTVSYVDEVSANRARDASARVYYLPAKWADTTVEFQAKTYPIAQEQRSGRTWRRFLTMLPAERLFTDNTSQVRPATKKTLLKMVQTFLGDGFPMFAPVNARIDKCGHVVIFDGNHRATSYALAFGVKEPMPVMIWDIQASEGCALRPGVIAASKSA
jgi:hypothetical protein